MTGKKKDGGGISPAVIAAASASLDVVRDGIVKAAIETVPNDGDHYIAVIVAKRLRGAEGKPGGMIVRMSSNAPDLSTELLLCALGPNEIPGEIIAEAYALLLQKGEAERAAAN